MTKIKSVKGIRGIYNRAVYLALSPLHGDDASAIDSLSGIIQVLLFFLLLTAVAYIPFFAIILAGAPITVFAGLVVAAVVSALILIGEALEVVCKPSFLVQTLREQVFVFEFAVAAMVFLGCVFLGVQFVFLFL